MSSPAADAFEAKIRQEIPAIRHFPFRVEAVDSESVRVSARLADHLNHKGTAFGGSLYQLALIASYGLFFNLLETGGFETRDFVIAKGKISYKLPVPADFEALCSVEKSEVERFHRDLKSVGKADLNLSASIQCRSQICASMESRFVAFFPER